MVSIYNIWGGDDHAHLAPPCAHLCLPYILIRDYYNLIFGGRELLPPTLLIYNSVFGLKNLHQWNIEGNFQYYRYYKLRFVNLIIDLIVRSFSITFTITIIIIIFIYFHLFSIKYDKRKNVGIYFCNNYFQYIIDWYIKEVKKVKR